MSGRLVLWVALVLSSLSSALNWLAQRYLLRTPAYSWRAIWMLMNLSIAASILLVTAVVVLSSSRMRGDMRDTVRSIRHEPQTLHRWLTGLAIVGMPLLVVVFGLLTTYALSRSHVSFFGPTRTLLGQLLLVLGAWVLLREKTSPWMLCGAVCLFAGLGFMIAHTVVTKNGFINH